MRHTGGLDCAHYYGRRYRLGRWHPDNCAPLCRPIHSYVDTHAAELVRLFTGLLGEVRHDELIKRMHGTAQYTPADRWEINRHYVAQLNYLRRQRAEGEIGYLPVVSWD